MRTTKRRPISLFLTAAALAVAGGTLADEPGQEARARASSASSRRTPGPFRFDGLVLSPLQLLGTGPVQAELKLDDTQKAKIHEALTSFRTEMVALNSDIQGLSREEVRKKFEGEPEKAAERRQKANAITEESGRKAEGALASEQLQRLKEIGYQLEGAAILNRPDVVDPLRLTDEQKQQLATVAQEAVASGRASLAGQVEPSVAEERVAQIRKETAEKAFAVLTDPQREQIAKLKGKPIAFGPELLKPVRDRTERSR